MFFPFAYFFTLPTLSLMNPGCSILTIPSSYKLSTTPILSCDDATS